MVRTRWQPEPEFRVGDRVRVAADKVDTGLEGVVEAVDALTRRMAVEIKVWGRVTTVEVGFDRVEKV